MRFSLVLATVGRTDTIPALLDSLCAQDEDFELLVVDQNSDDRLGPVLRPYEDALAMRHLRSDPGLSRARNAALPHLTGDVVAFPDDDCVYPPGLLRAVRARMNAAPDVGVVIGRRVDPSLAVPPRESAARMLRPHEIWPAGTCSIALFIRRGVLERVGGFDETLGLGAGSPWPSSEDVDLPWRAANAGTRVLHDPDIHVYHPAVVVEAVEEEEARARYVERVAGYARGVGRVWRKNGFPLRWAGYYLARSLGGCLINLARGRSFPARVQWAAFNGRLSGWRS